MIELEVEFEKSSAEISQCPETKLPEYAFIGRSNVGKSSLINMLTNRLKLAKISSRPGKTQLINHFLINKSWYLVDLPGYGWARTSKKNKKEWGEMNLKYLQERENLVCIFLLIDSRIDAQKIDIEFMNWVGEKGLPLVLVFTKMDKLSKNKVQKQITKIKKEFLNHWEELPQNFETSSENGAGREELLTFIEETNQVL